MWKRMKTIGAVALALMLLTNVSVQAQDTPTEPAGAEEAAPTIAALVADTDDFSTLAKALDAAGLTATLADASGDYTVFAPTNAAFAQLPEGKLETLMQPENAEKLRDILLYHVSEGTMNAGQLSEVAEVATMQGAAAPVTADGTSLSVGDASVVQADVAASNGVVHVVDAVLVPKVEADEEM